MFGFLRNRSEIGKLPAGLREQLEAEGIIFSVARVVATFPTHGDTNLRSIDYSRDTHNGPGTATITNKGLQIATDLHGVDHAYSGSMRLNYTKKIPDEVLGKLPTTSLRFPVQPDFVYRAAGVRPKS